MNFLLQILALMLIHFKVCIVILFIYYLTLLLGQEDDFIIISLVRTKNIGFLLNERRANVMLTRAKKGMFICCNFDLFKLEYSLISQMINEWANIENGYINYDDKFTEKLHL